VKIAALVIAWQAIILYLIPLPPYTLLQGPDGLPMPINPTDKMPSISQCQLEVDLSSLVFEHHHLFSLEHYLTTKVGD
jgi:hypothetical protein